MNPSIRREAVFSLFFRIIGIGGTLIANFLLIRQLSSSEYGVWATLTSLLIWIQMSDLGIGYTLKNRIAEAEKPAELLPLIAGAVQVYCLLAIFLCAVFVIFGSYVSVFRENSLESTILCIGTLSFFPLTVSAAILQGMRRNSVQSAMVFVQTTAWLVTLALLYLGTPRLWIISLVYVTLAISVGFFQFKVALRSMDLTLQAMAKAMKSINNISLIKPLFRISGQFVLLQLSGLVLFSLGTYLTYDSLSASDAAKYDIVYKFFQLPLTLFNIILSVYWPEISRSLVQRNRKRLTAQFSQLWALAIFFSAFTLVFAKYIVVPLVAIYSGGKVLLSADEALPFWLLITMQVCAYAGAVFLNAAELLRGQIYLALVSATALVPLVYILQSIGAGFIAVPIATCIVLLPSLCFCNWNAYFNVIKKIS